MVLLVGPLRLTEHQTVEEIHQALLRRLEPLGVKIARREILDLCEAYCTLLRARSEAKNDQEWLALGEKHGGIIVSVDGIPPEKGKETVYLVRDALTGRVLAAENVTSSETAVMKALLTPVVSLGARVLGTISDAQERERVALQDRWPEVPHQVCPFPVLRDASKKAFEAEKQAKTALRKHLYPKVREGRTQIKKHLSTASLPEATPLAVLDDAATGIMTALTTDGLQPFPSATVQATAMLDESEASLAGLAKKGGQEAHDVPRNWRVCRSWWRSEPPGPSNWRRANASTAGSWRLSICWTQAWCKPQGRASAMRRWEAAWIRGDGTWPVI